MPDYGTDKLSLQNTTGAIQNLDGGPILSTDSFGESSFIFSTQVQREIFYGITNGDFSQPTANVETGDFASDDNPLPYWTTTQVSSPSTGTVGFQSVSDATTTSGWKLRVLATAGATTGGTTTLTRFVPLGANASRDVGFTSTITLGIDATATNASDRRFTITGTFYAADGTTSISTAFATDPTATFADYLTDLGAGIKTYSFGSFLPPANAAFLRYEFKVATTGTNATERWIDLIDVSLYRTPPAVITYGINDPTKYSAMSAGTIYTEGTSLTIRTPSANTIISGGTITTNYVNGTNGLQSGGTILVGNADTNLYRFAANTLKTDDTFVMGAGTILFGTAATPDTNLYRNDVNQLRTDDRLIVGQRTAASVNLVDAPGGMIDADNGLIWADRSPNTAATDASLFLSSGYYNGNLQMVRFFRKITSGGTVLTGTGHILVANNATTAPSFGAGSDHRLKENIRTANVEVDFLAKINDLRPVLYTEKATGDELLGFVAHEVATVVPEAVEGEKDAVDENGDPVFQSLYAAKFIPYLIGAVQELSAKVADLESRLAELENK